MYHQEILVSSFVPFTGNKNGAGNGIRTLDPRLAKPMLCQLSYSPLFHITRSDLDALSGTPGQLVNPGSSTVLSVVGRTGRR